ncbi:Armadillo-like helical [Macrophomina phaseolina MS6]|uniref:Armadillo-like helical n=1 Tax=Macrophomina phaseolina (strain MS6) TaxID=1126212 RepID=K2RHY7_MACPH|nr:Armadillo-like helical [Macrophomina phaseolina MS6]
MEDQAASLLATLKKSSAPVDQKLTQFNSLKSSIKHLRVPQECTPTIFECVRLAIAAQTSSTLVSTGFSTLGHLVKRLHLQNQTQIIAQQSNPLLPTLLDRLGDARESHRNAASQALSDLWPYNHPGVESIVREGALGGTNSRAKEAAMQWVVKMHASDNLPFKSFTPYLVANLEDPDGMVRETAKSAVVELFRNAPDNAKNDLKKKMSSHNVRKTIANYIIANLGLPGAVEVDLKAPAASVAPFASDAGMADSVSSEPRPAPVDTLSMDPMYVYSHKEVEEIFREMHQHFDGRETEHNWLPREKSILKIRRMLKGNAPKDHEAAFVAGVLSLRDGILKVCNSLRTTHASNGCQLVQELARTLGPSIDPAVEIMLQNFIKMSANTKNIAAQNGNVTVDTIFAHASYNNRMMAHVGFAIADKNVQPRIFSAGWLKTLLQKNAAHRGHFEHVGGLESSINIIKKGLVDANPKVRENYRATYWAFSKMWPDKAEAIMESLDAKAQGLLQKDPNNPNAPAGSAGGKGTVSKLKSQASRSSLKDTIAAQRKAALAARKMPERPGSAQATFSPVKSTSSTQERPPAGSLSKSYHGRPPSALSNSRTQPGDKSSSASSGGGSLTAKPVRRPRMAPRPQTADPYASRNKNAEHAETPSMSPAGSPEKNTTKKASTLRGRPRAPSSKNSPITSPPRSKSRLEAIHRKSPSIDSVTASPSKAEDLTMVMPSRQRPSLDNALTDGRLGGHNDDDSFTMVIPRVDFSRSENQRFSSHTSPSKIPSPRPLSLSASLGISSPELRALAQNKTPKPKSPERSANDPISTEEVKVYEDPFAGEAQKPSGDEKPVLGELPVNEQNRDRRMGSETPDADRADISDGQKSNGAANGGEEVVQDRAEVLRTRRLLASGIERIRAKTLDAHGFRRLQDVVKGDLDIWGEQDQRFGELLMALLEYLESPVDTKTPNIKAQNLKTQVLGTIRAMLILHRKKSGPYYARALCSVLASRAQWDTASHITTEIEKTADEIVKYGQTTDLISGILDFLDSANAPNSPASAVSSDQSRPASASPSPRTVTLSLQTLSNLLQVSAAKNVPVADAQAQQLGHLAVKFLGSLDPDVRRADMDFCVQLHERLGGEQDGGFWKAVSGADKGHLNLITYYLARRNKA